MRITKKLITYKKTISSCLHPSCWEKIKSSQCLIIRHDYNCGYVLNGKPYSQIMDAFAEICNKHKISFQVIATPYSTYYLDKATNYPLTFNRDFLGSEILDKIFNTYPSKNETCKFSIAIWKKILKKSNAKIVVGIRPSSALCAAGKDCKIKVYDFQHGVIDDAHWWYGQQARHFTNKRYLPDGFLCWDQNSINSLRKWTSEKNIETINVGNPWFLNYFSSKNLFNNHQHENLFIDNDKPTILVSLQWGLHVYYKNHKQWIMPPQLEEAIQETSTQYNWLLRLHPIQMQDTNRDETFKYMHDKFDLLQNIDWEISSKLPLPVVLSMTDLHITDMSSVVIEASWFGIPSALLNPLLKKGEKLQNLFIKQRYDGYAFTLNQEKQEILSWITTNLNKKNRQKIKFSDKNITDFIKNIHNT
ncbi:hypothetical protein MTYM_01475 [Methylococcales bacterium]|nr:hypothetical protein MTYM_01475 [Methylococcales bacterium]